MKRLGAVSDTVAPGTVGAVRAHTEIIMAADTLRVKSRFPAGHHTAAHSALMTIGTGLWAAGVALLIVMVAVITIQAVFLGVGIVAKCTFLSQYRLVFGIRGMALAA